MPDNLSRRYFLQLAASGALASGLNGSRVDAQADVAGATLPLQDTPTLDGVLTEAPEHLELASKDRGGIVRRLPRAVLYPSSIEDVSKMVRYANAQRIPVSMRGRGHSAYGQALSGRGVVIDSSTLNQVVHVDANTINIEAGASLGTLARAAHDAGLRSPVMSGCAMLSVGGWLSVGGVAGESFRHGAFVDHVVELQVVVGDGRIVTCSSQREPELFAMALAGMGQCGLILRAKFRLTAAPERVNYRTIEYATLKAFLADQQRFAANERLDSLWAAISRREDGSWRYPVTIGCYGASGADIDPMAAIGNAARGISADAVELPYVDIMPPPAVARMTRRPAAAPDDTSKTGTLVSQPALCLFLPASVAHEIMMPLLSSPIDSAGISLIECVALNARHFHRPLFRLPREDRFFSCWILRTARLDVGASLQSQLDANGKFLQHALALGAVRYPPFAGMTTPVDWRAHYGENLYRRFATAKRKYDPRGILTGGARIFT